jgi:uncharacterized protein YlzI (FlbEa/FlbD family)
MFIKLTKIDTNEKILININHIIYIEGQDCTIWLTNYTFLQVQETIEEIMAQIKE